MPASLDGRLVQKRDGIVMRQLIIVFADALIPLSFAGLLLACPQWFTKKDLKADENRGLARKLRKIGWLLMAAGGLILIANIGSTVAKR
jgi:hypothetical protein